ncbi:MAG: HlyD family efflux transporter periplasmic adaptor subunit [Cytophagales bacterium]|nr:MAG: HlyD family efflux transporter periplasmic adaptor subunit [Cytophagales bacterium]
MKNTFNLLIFFALALFLMSCGGGEKKEEQKVLNASASTDTAKVLATNDRILGVARIEPEDGLTNITAGTSGKILAINVDDNQQVSKGQGLLEVEVAIENAQLAQAESKIGTQQAAIQASKANIEALKVNLKNVQDTYKRNLQLFEGKALTKESLDNSKANMDKLAKEVEAAEANLNQSNAKINELQADISYFKTVVNQKKVVAPLAGKILNILVKTGEYVSNATQIAEFAPEGSLIAKTEVDELFAEKIQIGQKATIISQTTGETVAEGKVSYAADYLKTKSLFKDQSTEQEDRRVREVHIKLESGKMPLIGSRVDCMIFLK